jgi:cytochrome c-type biogenesis protein
MSLEENNTYRGTITQDLKGVTKLGYNITVDYMNGTQEFSPKDAEYHYVNINTSSEDGITQTDPFENTLVMQILIIILVVVLALILAKHFTRKDKTKPMNKKLQVLMVVIFILIFAVLAVLFLNPGEVKEAPDFTLTDIDGNTFNLTDFKGDKVVLLDMMSIPCKGCKLVEADLKEIYPEYSDDVVFISVDVLADDTDEMLQDYRESHGIEWTIARDTDELILKYRAELIPKVIIINKDGFATYETGQTDVDTLKSELDDAISGRARAIALQEASFVSLAILAGVASFFSPCAFPMLPGYIAYYLRKDSEAGGKIPLSKAALSGTVSAAGIILVYIIIGILVVLAGTSIMEYIGIFGLIVGIVLIVLGILMFTPIQYWKIVRPFQNIWKGLRDIKKTPEKEGTASEATLSTESESGFYSGLFFYGLGYGAAASGCTAPLFIAVMLAAMVSGSLPLGITILILYTLSAALLMISVTIAIAYFGAGAAQKLSQYTDVIKKVSGAVLVVVGFYLLWIYITTA